MSTTIEEAVDGGTWLFDRSTLEIQCAVLDEEASLHFGFWFPTSTRHASREDAEDALRKHCRWQIERYQKALDGLDSAAGAPADEGA